MTDLSMSMRLLDLLGLFQGRRYWSGAELAERLGVEPRTVRRDVEKLRHLGYRISAVRGLHGGYELQSGLKLPPMLLSEGEAVALAVALGTVATTQPMVGFDELAVSTLAKLEHILPDRLRSRVAALRAATVSPPLAVGVRADPESLSVIALACRDSELLSFDYTSAVDTVTERRVEPLRLVPRSGHWYLIGRDVDRAAWRTFRVDRIAAIRPTGGRFVSKDVAAEDVAELLFNGYAPEGPTFRATVVIDASLPTARAYLGHHVRDLVARGQQTVWEMSDPRLEVLAGALVWLPWAFEVEGCPELQRLLGELAGRFAAAAG